MLYFILCRRTLTSYFIYEDFITISYLSWCSYNHIQTLMGIYDDWVGPWWFFNMGHVLGHLTTHRWRSWYPWLPCWLAAPSQWLRLCDRFFSSPHRYLSSASINPGGWLGQDWEDMVYACVGCGHMFNFQYVPFLTSGEKVRTNLAVLEVCCAVIWRQHHILH